MLEAIPDPKKTTIEADIELQLWETLISIIAMMDPSLDASFTLIEVVEGDNIDPSLQDDYIAS
jgi:hypothetical protein